MLRDGTVDKADDAGATVVDNLVKLDNQTMAKGLDRGVVMDEVLETVTSPGVIHQDSKGSCTVTTLEYLHVRKDPSDYIRVVGDLTEEGGVTTLKNGEKIIRNPNGLAVDGTTRSNIDRVYQSTMMDYGGGGHYDNVVDGHISASGLKIDSGLAYKGTNRVEDGVLGGKWKREFLNVDDPMARSEFEKEVAGAAGKDEHVPIAMRWAEDPKDVHAGHMLSAYKVDDDFVYLRNPWGRQDDGLGDGPAREILGDGNVRIKKTDFYARVQGYDVQVAENTVKMDAAQIRADMLERFQKQSLTYADNSWENSASDLIGDWTPETRELHRSTIKAKADGILQALHNGADVYDVAEVYKLNGHYGLEGRPGQVVESAQMLNRTQGVSNVYGASVE